MKRKIALLMVVMSLLLSVLAIPANAVKKTKSTPYGTLTAEMDSFKFYYSNSLKGKEINFMSSCVKTAPRIIATAEVLRWSDGKFLYKEQQNNYNTNYAGYYIDTSHFTEAYGDDFYNTKITVYGSHEIRANQSYGLFTQLIGV